jgi:flagellar motor switch protein FliN/FliY
VNVEPALLRLGGTTSDAIVEVLQRIAGEHSVTLGSVEVVPEGVDPLEGVPLPAVAADVSYVDGVTGGNVVAIPVVVGRRLANALMGTTAERDEAEALSELELSALGEAMNQMMAAAALATSAFLGQEVEMAPPRTVVLESEQGRRDMCVPATYAVSASFLLFGVGCTLVQLVPNAFVVRLTRALEEITHQHDGEPLGEALWDIPVRLWVELGRARLPMGRFVALPPGEVVELDREAEEPIDLYVDGMHFGTGRLLVSDEGDLSVRIETVAHAGLPRAETHPSHDGDHVKASS